MIPECLFLACWDTGQAAATAAQRVRSGPVETVRATNVAGDTASARPLGKRIIAVLRQRWPVFGPWFGTLARLILAGVFIVAGALKVGDLAESGRAANAYDVLPIELGRFVGAVLPFMEIMVGVLLLVGLATRVVAFVNGLMYLVFITAIAQAWARGLTIDCGCFGEGGQVAPEDTRYASEIFRDTLLFGLTAFLVVFPRTRYSLDACLAGPEENE
ncbi:MAG: DoxX family membrane protein [Micromonosporaceae bacterium]|nr:DoxX family membrane protein [Micromonosporaceae bacterium]